MLRRTPTKSYASCLGRRWKSYDLAVLGAGPGGYVAAIKAAQEGMSVACVEERTRLGGTCLNVGCIPTKALLNMSQKFHETEQHAKFGFKATTNSTDLIKMNQIKAKTVDGLAKGIAFLFKKNNIHLVHGKGRIASPNSIAVAKTTVDASNIILATGSVVAPMPGLTIDEKKVLSSDGATELRNLPNKMIIIGAAQNPIFIFIDLVGGAIGLEFASIYSRLGTEVQVVEFMPQIAVGMDRNVADELLKVLQQQKIKFYLNHRVVGADVSGTGVKIHATSDGKPVTFDGDVVLVAVGRKPNSQNLGLEEIGIELDKNKRVVVDDYFRTSVPTIRAIGDLIHGPMLAHKAEEDAVACVSAIKGHLEKVDYEDVPAVIYTHPEVACFGVSEEKLKTSKIPYTKGQFPFAANARARANQESEGFVKILACKTTGKILGGSIIGSNAGDMIQTLLVAKSANMSATELGQLVHPHPCLSEAIKEAALLAGGGKAIHI